MTDREIKYQEYDERIDRYLHKRMDGDERTAFEHDVNNDDELRKRLVAASLLATGIAQAGNRREGQAQIDAIRHMSKEEFLQAAKAKEAEKATAPGWMKKTRLWVAAIAAAIVIALVIPIFNKPVNTSAPVVTQAPKAKVQKAPKAAAPVKPTLAQLADKYNKPVPGSSDEMAELANQIRQGGDKETMTALANSIVEAQDNAVATAKGAEDGEAVKEAHELYNDCAHWYKALALLKAGDKDAATSELTALRDTGHTQELVTRATRLLKELEQ